jgi:hypothetical protein
MVVSHWIEHQTGWSIKTLVRTPRRYRTVTIDPSRRLSLLSFGCRRGSH